jgi:sec-independent protein translocase protein TatC
MNSNQRGRSDREIPLTEHLEELSRRLRVVVYVLAGATIGMMTLPANSDFFRDPLSFYDPLVSVILKRVSHDLLPPQLTLIGYQLGAPIELYVISSLVLGVLITMPVMAYEIYGFVNPALYEHEKRAVYPFMTAFTTLFVAGAAFGYVIIAPFMIWAMIPFFSAVGAQPVISVIDFYSVVFVTILMSGLTFTFPVFFVLLVRFGVIGTAIVTKNRRYLYAGVFLLTAIITPDGGPIADAALFIPIIVLFEVAILVAKRYEKPGQVVGPAWLRPPEPCKYCGADIVSGARFCWKCGRAQH